MGVEEEYVRGKIGPAQDVGGMRWAGSNPAAYCIGSGEGGADCEGGESGIGGDPDERQQ